MYFLNRKPLYLNQRPWLVSRKCPNLMTNISWDRQRVENRVLNWKRYGFLCKRIVTLVSHSFSLTSSAKWLRCWPTWPWPNCFKKIHQSLMAENNWLQELLVARIYTVSIWNLPNTNQQIPLMIWCGSMDLQHHYEPESSSPHNISQRCTQYQHPPLQDFPLDPVLWAVVQTLECPMPSSAQSRSEYQDLRK